MAVLFSYSAVGSNANPVGSPWTTITGWGDVERASNHLNGVGGAASGAYVSTVTPPNDQYMELTFGASYNNGAGPMVRAQTGSASGYGIQVLTGTDFHIFRYDSGSYNTIHAGTCDSFAPGDVWLLSAVGTTITAYQNGVQKGQVTDATYASGRFGGFWWTSGSAISDAEGGDFGTGVAPAHYYTMMGQ